jgi:hypothetical protein
METMSIKEPLKLSAEGFSLPSLTKALPGKCILQNIWAELDLPDHFHYSILPLCPLILVDLASAIY